MMPSAETPKAKRSDQFRLWNGGMMMRPPTIRYGTEASPDEVIQALRTLHNGTSRTVVVTKTPMPQGVGYSFSLNFRVKVNPQGSWQPQKSRRVTASRVNGIVMAGEDYSTILEFTPELVRPSLWSMVGFIALMVMLFPNSSYVSSVIHTLIVILFLFYGVFVLILPFFSANFGPGRMSLDQRLTDVLLKIQAFKIEATNTDEANPKRSEA